MGSPGDPRESSFILCELLRRTLSLVEYYGRLESNEASLFELKLVLIRTVERLECEQAARAAADLGREPDHVLSLRKAPHSEVTIAACQGKELDQKR
jgi:hypothetical protein